MQEQGITYDTEDEYREAAYNLVNYVDLMLQLSIEHNGGMSDLKQSPTVSLYTEQWALLLTVPYIRIWRGLVRQMGYAGAWLPWSI